MARPKNPNRHAAIIAKDFARRLDEACNLVDHIPEHNFGRLRYIGDELEKRGIKVSKETVRKWFAGEAKPKADKMKTLASIVKADEAWLTIGYKAGIANPKKQAHNIEGAINLVAGLFKMNGANFAWPNGQADDTFHFHAILDGRSHMVYAALAHEVKGGYKFVLPVNHDERLIIGVIQRGPFAYDLFQLPSNMISKSGLKKGGFTELKVTDNGDWLSAAGNRASKLEDFTTIQ